MLLSEPTITDDDLGLLFHRLPDPCIVLPEDIDATSFVRKKENVQSSVPGPDEGQGISLSGLLNAIDGVASPEGVILIMTTNHPEKLDDALIRDTRVDLKARFALPGKGELRNLCLRMYTHKVETSTALKTSGVPSGDDILFRESPFEIVKRVTVAFGHTDIAPANLRVMAEDFAARLPRNTWSTAEIQGYLVPRKIDAQVALASVTQWAKDVLAAKAKQEPKGTVGGSIGSSITIKNGVNNIKVGGTQRGEERKGLIGM